MANAQDYVLNITAPKNNDILKNIFERSGYTCSNSMTSVAVLMKNVPQEEELKEVFSEYCFLALENHDVKFPIHYRVHKMYETIPETFGTYTDSDYTNFISNFNEGIHT